MRLYAKYALAFPSEPIHKAAFAEATWSRATLETNPKLRAVRWEQAATAFGTLGTFAGTHAAARAALNALDFDAPADATVTLARTPARVPKPVTLDTSAAQIVVALRAYITLATTARPATPRMVQPLEDAQTIADDLVLSRLALASTLRRHRHLDEAIAVLDEFIADHPDDAHAELAANWLLDSMVQARSPNLGDVVAAMLADRPFITGKLSLIKNLSTLHTRAARR
jgi:hypothetical protein